MTLSSFAAAQLPGANSSGAAGSAYRPGVCNIGPAEIARRRRAGHVGLAATLLVLGALVLVGAPPLARLILILPAAGSASGYLQAWFKFCAGFGSRGVFNFGPLGQAESIPDPASRARDRVRAFQIGMASLAVGIVVGVIAVLIPLS